MGIIVQDVKSIFLIEFPHQEEILKPFLHGFDVTYAEKKNVNNTDIFVYLLKPEAYLSEAFGIDKEILLAYSPYDKLLPRAIQAVNILFNMFPFKNRIDTLNCFVVSKDAAVIDYAGITSFSENQSRSIVPFVYSDLITGSNDSWYLRNQLRKYFFDVDLFGYTLPLHDETYFFGRQQVAARYIDAVKRSENRGIFGIRKTGKTSLLFKIERVIHEQNLGYVLFYDCKTPQYRSLHWNDFLAEICGDIARKTGLVITKKVDERGVAQNFKNIIQRAASECKKIVIIFDEIEYISFRSPTDSHWHSEFINFWQTIWSVQSLYRNLVFILSGVNPSVTEIDSIDGIQNPLFGIVQSEYLQGLPEDDARLMIRTLGKRMGLRFEHDAISMLYNQYNGHPMLLRMACSYLNRLYINQDRPVTIMKNDIYGLQDDIDIDLVFYFKHVVSEIEQFYPEEYEMFEMLASGQTSDFIELSAMTELTRHLYNYGLIAKNSHGIPYVKMPVAGRYVAMELAKREKRTSLYKVVNPEHRSEWVTQRIKSIIRDLRQLEMIIRSTGGNKLFGENSFPEADRFLQAQPVNSEAEFIAFFNICNRCFVESIENYGKFIGKNKYFWNEIKNSYPALFDVLHKIKVYRHSEDHLVLNQDVAKLYSEFWNEDTRGIKNIEEQRFVIQQKLLEDFLTAILIETSR